MAGKSKRAKLILTPEELEQLQQLSRSTKAEAREVRRAQILTRYQAGETVAEIARLVGMTRISVAKWINRALSIGPSAALKDKYHRPKAPVITEDASQWVVSLACSKPKDLGYAAEFWTRSALAMHVRTHADEAGHPSLNKAVKATVHRILARQPLHPERISYYLERRDPRFDEKMKDVLLVYRAVSLQNEESGPEAKARPVFTVSVDEKPGVQAIANTAPDLAPVPGKHQQVARDHEYKRLGTCSILAALDLHDGHITARVEDRHRSVEFVALLKDLDSYYSAGMQYPYHSGQPLGPPLQGDLCIFGNTPQPLPLRTDSHPWIMAQHCRDSVWKDGANFPQAHTGEIVGRVEATDTARNRRNQRRPGGSPVEEVWRA
jgi:transposase